MKLDWLECTIVHRPAVQVLDELKSLFIGCSWTDLDRGGLGYDRSALVGKTGRVWWSTTRSDMGVHVSLPATFLDTCGVSPESLLVDLYNLCGKFTRIDFAADDFQGKLDLKVIEEKTRNQTLVTRFKQWTHVENNFGGQTWSYGSRVSDSYIRIYDKAAEQKIQGHWIRVELELKHERAEAAGKFVVENRETWGEAACGWIRSSLDFKEESSDENKSRWDTSDWWLGFLEHSAKVKLFVTRVIQTVDSIVQWIENQVAPSLYTLCMTVGWQEVLRVVGDACGRLSPVQSDLIAGFNTG